MVRMAAQAVALPAIADLDSLDAFRDKLMDVIESGDAAIDGGAVERIATNALLMLLSAAETAHQHKSGFVVQNTSEPMQSAIERLGLMPRFEPLMKG